MSLNTEQLRKLCDKMENKEGLKLAKVLKNGNNDETESEEEEVVEAKHNVSLSEFGNFSFDGEIGNAHS
ncbi:hypothetical protein YC2023_023435 [Brassica napus]